MILPNFTNIDHHRIAQSSSTYCAHPLRLVQIKNFLHSPAADAVNRFLTSGADFGPIYGLHNVPGHIVDQDKWQGSEESNRFFHYEMLAGTAGRRPDPDSLAFLKLRQFLSSDSFCELGRQITGKPISSATQARVHRLRHGHFLHPHNDRLGDRQIAYIVYLSPNWEPQFGGRLKLAGKDGSRHQLSPSYNSLVLFDVTLHHEHFIEALTVQSNGWARDTISGWFVNDRKD